ncbi:MAG: hypothetical protein ABID83_04965, partial [Candidatus Omnitrophota bacterium]
AKTPPKTDHSLTAFRLIGLKGPENKAKLLVKSIFSVVGPEKTIIQQNLFLSIPQFPVSYWLGPKLLNTFSFIPRNNRDLFISEGIGTRAEHRFVRYYWESFMPTDRWCIYSKGGGYKKWYGFQKTVVDWGSDGPRVKEYIRQNYPPEKFTLLIRHERLYKRSNFTYSSVARGSLSARDNSTALFSDGGPGIFWRDRHDARLLTFLNSRLASYLSRGISSGGLTLNRTYVELLPVTQEILEKICSVKAISFVIALKKFLTSRSLDEYGFLGDVDFLFNNSSVPVFLHLVEGFFEKCVFAVYDLNELDVFAIFSETGAPAGWHPLIAGYDALPPLPEHLPEIPSEVLDFLQTHERQNTEILEFAALKSRLRSLYEARPGAHEEVDDTDGEASEDEEEENDHAVGARIPIPAETFLEELSQKIEVHPISVYWLLKEGIEQDRWRCMPEEQRLTKDRFTVLILRLLGHRWPKQIEAGEPVPDWADDDGIVPLMEGTDKATLHARLRGRLAADYGDKQVSSEENAFADIMGKPLAEWVRKDFFRHHISQFKKRPIAWHLSSARWTDRPRQDAAFECLIYYQKTDGDLLPKLKNQYVIPLMKRLEMELRGLENANGGLTGEQKDKKDSLRYRIQELKAFDVVLTEVSASGFGPEALRPQLRQYAVNDATLCIKARWL